MSDVNASVAAIDSAMDCFEKINDSARNYQKVVQYDVSELLSSIEYKLRSLISQINMLYNRLDRLEEDEAEEREEILAELRKLRQKREKLELLKARVARLNSQYRNDSYGVLRSINDNVSSGLRVMAAYLKNIVDIDGAECFASNAASNIFTGESNYCVVVIDSDKYPQSAEHIKAAINNGKPAMLTLNRSGADENRKRSLAGIPVSSVYDRDEYPPAAFQEGGAGAHVAYINPADNQGSGSSFRWQLNGVPDGTRVRFRVI